MHKAYLLDDELEVKGMKGFERDLEKEEFLNQASVFKGFNRALIFLIKMMIFILTNIIFIYLV
ncbi:conserved hypothetical protein (plasmid) [Borreliella finlandensis]|uniref:Uncharacterized protein n=1 Tax=Borreliella finlandensis TaxID=498741 RepID=A0A826GN29_9SPIR|nr:conserved hypothetical protein [Borreliella finlandensis]